MEIKYPNWLPKIFGSSQTSDEMNGIVEVLQNHAETLSLHDIRILAASGGIYTDALTPTSDVPTEVGDKVFLVTEPGTYTNFGNVNLLENHIGFIFKNSTNFILQSVVMPIQDLTPLETKIEKKVSKTSLDEVVNFSEYISFTLRKGDLGTNGIPNTSVNWLNTAPISCEENNSYTVTGLGQSTQTLVNNRIYFYKDAVFQSKIGAYLVDPLTFTTPAGCNSFAILIDGATDVALDLSNSIYLTKLKISKGASIKTPSLKGESIKGNIVTDQVKNIEKVTKTVAPLIEISYTISPISTTSGFVTKTGGTGSIVPGYLRTSVSNTSSPANVDVTKNYTYSGEITENTSNIAGVVYLSSTYAVLGFDCTSPGVYVNKELILPANTKLIATCSYGVAPVINEILVGIKSVQSDNVLYIDQSVTVSGNGTASFPCKTINEAIDRAGSNTTFLIRKGDYRETLAWAKLRSGNYEFTTLPGETVRILGSNKLIGWTKTEGTANVYEIPYTETVMSWARFKRPIFEEGNPSFPILDEERSPLQRGLNYRLPYTVLEEVSSIAELDTKPGVFYATGKMYVHASNSTNPNENGFSYEIVVRSANTYPASNNTKIINLKLNNLQFRYNSNGVTFIRFNQVVRYNVSSLATRGAGAFRDDVGTIVAYDDEAGGSDVDGINGHFSSYGDYQSLTNNRTMSPLCVYFNPWCHDNQDDGISHHENHRVMIFGGLSEYNADGGVRASNDSGYTIYNFHARRNGFGREVTQGGVGGEGISAVNPTINTNRNGCKVDVYNSIVEYNNCGYASISDNRNVVNVYGGVTRHNNSELYCNAGKVIAHNVLGSNINPERLKVISGTGQIITRNDTLIL